MRKKLLSKTLVIGVIILFVGASIVQGDTITSLPKEENIEEENTIQPTFTGNIFYPTDDSNIVQGYPDNTPGNNVYMTIVNEDGGSGTGCACDALVKFDISSLPSDGILISAICRLYYYDWGDNNPAGRPLTCRRITSDWDEATVTWNTQPSYASIPTTSTPVPSSPGTWIEWDVKSDVEAFIDGTYDNFGWKISDETPWGWLNIPRTRTRSKEYGTNIPELEVKILIPHKTILIGSIEDLNIDGDITTFNAINLRYIQFGPFQFKKLTAGEEFAVTGSRLGVLTSSFAFGIFNGGLI